MIGLSDVSSGLGAASDALGAVTGAKPPAAATPAAPGTPQYLRGVHIDQEDEEVGGATAPNLVNDRDTHPQIEFIHFGNVHTSYGNLFPHDSCKDNETVDPLAETARPRAIQFRSALEREAILLSTFIESAQTVLVEREGGGALGALANAAGSLLGGGGGAGGVSSSDLNAPLTKGISAAGTLNAATIQYHDTHQAGMDFHQARTDYRGMLQKVVAEAPKAAPGASLLSALPGTGSIAGPVGGLVKFTQAVVFKSADIKIKCFALVAAQQERQIELACHGMTMAAITNLGNPFLPVWCPPPEKKSALDRANDLAAKAAQTKNLADAFNSAVGDPFGLAPKKEDADGGDGGGDKDTQGEEKGFFDVDDPPDSPAGGEFVTMAFAVPEVSKVPSDPVPMEMGKLTCQGFIAAIGQPSLPPLVESIVKEVDTMVSDFVTKVYQTLLIRPADEAVDQQKLVKAAIEDLAIVDKLKALTIDKLTFLKDAENANVSAMGYSLDAGDLMKDANTKIEDLFNDRIEPVVNTCVGAAMGEMAKQLELARQDSASTKSYTMEWYLGRLPWVRTCMFHHLFFPFWSALMRGVVEVTSGPAGAALKALVDASDKLKGATDAAKAQVDRAQNVATNVGEGLGTSDPSRLANIDKGAAGAAAGNLLKSVAPPMPIARGKFRLPFTGRLADGQGVDITDYDDVAAKHQWDQAIDPDAPATEDDSTAADPAADGGGGGSGGTPTV